MTGYGFYWNLDLLEQYGLSVPKQKDEFLAVCETLKKNGITPYVAHKDYALVVPALVIGLSEIYESSDKEALLHDLATGKTKISDYMKKGFEFVQLLIDKGYIDVNDAKHRNAKDAGIDFVKEKVHVYVIAYN
ncbi:MAG: extracellular solute-binding protein [Longibaculum sp.]